MAEHIHLDREEIAKREIGVTEISRNVTWFLVIVFLATIVSIPLIQLSQEWGKGTPGVLTIGTAFPESWKALRDPANGSWWDRIFAANAILLRHINEYEKKLEDDSFVATESIPRMQVFTSRYLGLGNEQVYLGQTGWLFYRPGVDSLTGPGFLDPGRLKARALAGSETSQPVQPDPRKAILDFKKQLEARGIELVIVPAPVKPMVQPQKFSRAYRDGISAVRNPSADAFFECLKAEGVRVFDPAARLVERLNQTEKAQYLQTDTHWRPEAMEAVAKELAAWLRTQIDLPAPEVKYRLEKSEVEGMGDIAVMLKLPKDQTLYPTQRVPLRVVLSETGEVWRASRSAQVLLLGDSFSNVFSLPEMNWGESAGFAEQLSVELGLPLDTILRNDAGAYATRELLANELAKGVDRLAGKRVVIWEFASRELAVGDWKILPLKLGKTRPQLFYSPEEGTPAVSVKGIVESVSPIPRPGSVPYKDHVFAIHLTDLQGKHVTAGSQAVVYLRSMRDGKLTDAARIRAGDEIEVRLSAWNDVAEKYDRLNRSELDDPDLQLEIPCWGEPSKPNP